MKPSPAAMSRLPRIAKITRIVSHDTSMMRAPKISSAPYGVESRASKLTLRNLALSRHPRARGRPVLSLPGVLERGEPIAQPLVLDAHRRHFGRDVEARLRLHRRQPHRPLGPEGLRQREDE